MSDRGADVTPTCAPTLPGLRCVLWRRLPSAAARPSASVNEPNLPQAPRVLALKAPGARAPVRMPVDDVRKQRAESQAFPYARSMHLDRPSCYRALLSRDPRFDGHFFTAVKSTGIYCRPICPARTPKLENIMFLPSAAAAQACGFRPCLRCRPELSPELSTWGDSAHRLSRAVDLLCDGALDDHTVEQLARRVGVSGRQLRRLFRQHLGAPPKAVAQARRVHFAKQLITDTAMPMTEVALAAGFGSLRRFNDTLRAIYGTPPSRLRRATVAAPDSGVTLELPFKPPYDWDSILKFLEQRAIPRIEAVRDGCYMRSIAVQGAHGWILVRRAPDANALHATLRFAPVTAWPSIVQRLRRLFDLGADPVLIDRHLGADEHLAKWVEQRPGLRVPGAWDPFELATRAILGQQVTVAAARALAARLATACGTRIPVSGELAFAELDLVFPSAQQVAGVQDLASVLGMPRARATSLHRLACVAQGGSHWFDGGSGSAGSIGRLRELPGFGDWTAQYFAMRALHDPDAFPATDVGLQRASAVAGMRPTASELLARAGAWRPWRAYAALHLWASESAARRSRQACESIE